MDDHRTDLRKSMHHAMDEMRQSITKMGQLIEEMIYGSVKSLEDGDVNRAKQLVDSDNVIDSMRLEIEEICLRLLALQQPMASDLRMISSALTIVTDLERVADHACFIAKTVTRLAGQTLVKPLVEIPKMSELARQMIHEAMKAYIERDIDRAYNMAALDDDVDQLYSFLFKEIHELIGTDSNTNRQLIHLLMVANSLERIADHATNVGEAVIYMVTGERKELND